MRTWLRSAAFNAAFFGFTGLTALVAIPLLAFASEPVLWRLARGWARGVLWLLRRIAGIRLCVRGGEHLPAGPGLVAAQHQSAFDTVVWLALLQRPAVVLKTELLRIPVYGWFCRRLGMIAIDRDAGAAAIRAMLRGADAAVAAGRPVLIFPEGTRAEPGRPRPFHPGVVALARRIGGAVIPVATDSGLRWGRRAFHKRAGTISILVLPPVAVSADRDRFLADLEAAVAAGYRTLHPEPVDNSVGMTSARLGRDIRLVL